MRGGTRYLRRSLVRASNTANAVRAFDRFGYASPLSFMAGWLTSELPLHTIAVQAIGTVRAARRGDLRSPAGALGLAIDVASWSQLYGIHRRAMQAGRVFDEALATELGTDWESHVAESWRPTERPLRASRLAQPFELARRTKCRHKNVSYGPAGRRNLLDVFQPDGIAPGAKAPVLLQVHGGGWIIGNKEEQGQPLMAHLCEQGWVCVAINYALSPKAKWPAHIVDVKRAIAWVKEHIAEYGGDPDFIVITGGSAGGHLSSLAALTANDPAYQPGFESADTPVQACVPFYGVFDFTNRDGNARRDMQSILERHVFPTRLDDDRETWDLASTMSRVHPDAPPFFVIHGTNDALAPVEQARTFVDLLRKDSQAPVVYAELPGAQHAYEIFWSPRTHATVLAVARFVAFVRSEHERVGL